MKPDKRQALKPVRPNEGLEAEYRKRLESLIDKMNNSIAWWIEAAYRQNKPVLTQDASSTNEMGRIIRSLARRWQGKFDEEAPNLARWFGKSVMSRADNSFQQSLKSAGFSVKFALTRAANDVLQATVAGNVSLIKSIPSEYFSEIEGMVFRSIAQGRDIGGLSAQLKERFGITKNRASLIARTENGKATANITRVRQEGLGIKQAMWMHSRGGGHPRKSHVEANGKVYDVSKGMLIDGEYIRPGELINCRCVCRSIIPGIND